MRTQPLVVTYLGNLHWQAHPELGKEVVPPCVVERLTLHNRGTRIKFVARDPCLKQLIVINAETGGEIGDKSRSLDFRRSLFCPRVVKDHYVEKETFGRSLVTDSFTAVSPRSTSVAHAFPGEFDFVINLRELHGNDADFFAYVEFHWVQWTSKRGEGQFDYVLHHFVAQGLLSGALTEADPFHRE